LIFLKNNAEFILVMHNNYTGIQTHCKLYQGIKLLLSEIHPMITGNTAVSEMSPFSAEYLEAMLQG